MLTRRVFFGTVLLALMLGASGARGQQSDGGKVSPKPTRPSFRPADYASQTEVFGIRAKGTRFLYVFDRSGSMSDYEGRPLAAAKRQLIGSLKTLRATHQFQIIFFNENPRMMNLAHGQAPRMVFADEDGKRLAEAFVESITADGGTDRLAALRLAMRAQPDVIFFLSDAEQPGLSGADLRSIAQLNTGCAIHVIEFGAGSAGAGKNFLHQLAQENAGEHVYVDVTKLGP